MKKIKINTIIASVLLFFCYFIYSSLCESVIFEESAKLRMSIEREAISWALSQSTEQKPQAKNSVMGYLTCIEVLSSKKGNCTLLIGDSQLENVILSVIKGADVRDDVKRSFLIYKQD